MKIDFDEAKNVSPDTNTGRVCMFVLSSLRMDARVMRAANALSNAGFAVSVVDIVDNCSQTTENIDGITVRHVKAVRAFIAIRFKPWAMLKALLLFLRSTLLVLRTPADFYHAHDVTALPTCYIAARLRRKPLIFDAHELPLSELDGTRRRWLRILLTPLLSHMISSCAGGIGASPFYEQNLRERYHISRVSLIRNVPPYRSVQKNDRLRQYLGLNSDTRIALYQGYLQYGRGLDKLIQAAAFLDPSIVIVMMGKGKGAGDASSQLKDLIAREKLTDRVKIIPHVPYKELLDWIVSADIGLITYQPDYSMNFQMCLPNKLFECLMAGLPVLSSELDAVIDVFKTHNVGQILPSLAPKDIGTAINNMLFDPPALASMHRVALDAAQNEFNWEREKSKLIRLYYEIQTDSKSRERKHYKRQKAPMSILSPSSFTRSVFLDWITEYCTSDSCVLDIGAGKDKNQIDAAIQPRVLRLIGIDSSEDILFNPSVHERYLITLENFAQNTHEKFDILICTMVLEHVTDPDTFFSACRKLLKPGGTFFAVTPNMWHYFGLTTKITSELKINEWLLDRLIGKQSKEAYHFPTFYKVNSMGAMRKILTCTGFHDVEFRCFDNWIEYRYVLPKKLHWFPKLYSRLVYRFNLPSMMGRIMFRATAT